MAERFEYSLLNSVSTVDCLPVRLLFISVHSNSPESAINEFPLPSLEQIAAKRWDVVVVGAGPAGTMTARGLALSGASVLLLEKASFPRYKVCGCCLNPRSIGLLAAAGLGSLLKDCGGSSLTSVKIAAGGRVSTVRLPGGIALSRETMDTALVKEAIQAGAVFLQQTTAKLDAEEEIDHRSLRLKHEADERTITTRFVVDASGLGGKLVADLADDVSTTSRIGAGVMIDYPHDYLAGAIYMACGSAGYVGLVRVEQNRLDIATAFDPVAVKEAGGLGRLAEKILAEAGFQAIPGLADQPWKGTPFLTRQRESLAEHRVFRIGDAAGYVEPFTGEGMAWALASASAIVPIIRQGLNGSVESSGNDWRLAYGSQVARRQLVCRWASRVLRRPRLTKWIVRLLSFAPSLAVPVLRQMHRP